MTEHDRPGCGRAVRTNSSGTSSVAARRAIRSQPGGRIGLVIAPRSRRASRARSTAGVIDRHRAEVDDSRDVGRREQDVFAAQVANARLDAGTGSIRPRLQVACTAAGAVDAAPTSPRAGEAGFRCGGKPEA